eukprot:UN25971
MVGFVIFIGAGGIFLGLAMFYMSALLLGSAYKFAFAYSVGNIFLIFSSAWLVGVKGQCSSMFSEDRRRWSVLYLLTLSATIYCSMNFPYVYVMIPIVIVQGIALTMYIFSNIPGGTSSLQYCGSGGIKMFRWMIGW